MNPHFKALEAAYQLHFYLCFKTQYLKPLLATRDPQSLVQQTLHVCERREYHLLETEITDDHLRLLVSLQPSQTISDTAKMLKGNLDHQFGLNFRQLLELNHITKLWARGYFARSPVKSTSIVHVNTSRARLVTMGSKASGRSR